MVIQLSLDSSKEVNVVTTYKLFEFLGDVTGIQQALMFVFMTVGLYISQNLYTGSLVEKVFKNTEKYTTLPQDIKFNTIFLLLYPLFDLFIRVFCFCKKCDKCKIK